MRTWYSMIIWFWWFLILVALFFFWVLILKAFAAEDGFTWKNRVFKGEYHCVGKADGYIWAAILQADGRGKYIVVDIVASPEGTSEPQTLNGIYAFSGQGERTLILTFPALRAEAVFIVSGKGFLLNNSLAGFVGECWR